MLHVKKLPSHWSSLGVAMMPLTYGFTAYQALDW